MTKRTIKPALKGKVVSKKSRGNHSNPKPTKPTGKKAPQRKIGKNVAKVLMISEKSVHGSLSLTQEKINTISRHIEIGNFAVTACALADVPERTFYHWLDVARKDEQEGKVTLHTNLLQSIKKASALAESKNMQIALLGGLGWAANMTFLERRFPDRWGQQSKLSLEEARSFVHKIMSVLAMHISDRTILEKIVNEVRNIEVEKNERIG